MLRQWLYNSKNNRFRVSVYYAFGMIINAYYSLLLLIYCLGHISIKNVFLSFVLALLCIFGPMVFIYFYECCWYELDAILYE